MTDLIKTIEKYVLENAIKHKGRANPGAIVGKLISEDRSVISKMKEIKPEIDSAVKRINDLSFDDQYKLLENTAPELLEKKEVEKKSLKDLPDAVQGKVCMRIAPSPSGPLHIGHAYVTALNYDYVKRYDGKMIVRVEDTNPEKIYPQAYDMIKADADWICQGEVSEFIIQSNRMDLYYRYAEEQINAGNIYICTCDPDEFREKLKNGISCSCRDLNIEEQMNRWKKMFSDFLQGQAVARFKTDLNHKNPAMRDFPIFRINDAMHPRTGKTFRVWPLMNWSVAIDDMDLGITHTLRGKDHADNAKRQALIHEALNVKTPVAISVGRVNFNGLEVSCSKVLKRMSEGEFNGWDDIRLPFLLPLRLRGIQPEALRKFAIEIGISKTDKTVDGDDFFKTVYSFNREILDAKTNRYFFVEEPVEFKIKGNLRKNVELNLHPEDKKGGRSFTLSDIFYVSKEDYENINSKDYVRLMDCINFQNEEYVSDSYEDFKNKGKKIIHWLPKSDDLVDTKILMPDGSMKKGLSEATIRNLQLGDIVQFERFGFCRLHEITSDNIHLFWFAHK